MNIHNYVIQKVQIATLKLILIFNDSTYVTIIMYYNKNTSTSWILQLVILQHRCIAIGMNLQRLLVFRYICMQQMPQ